jgi:hypothetical protein
MRDFRICGRVARVGTARYRALASAVPREPGLGPDASDMRGKVFSNRDSARAALGLLVHAVAQRVMARGDRVTALDVR